MRRLLLLVVLTAVAAAMLSAPAMADGKSLGPPGGTIYAFDQALTNADDVVATASALVDTGVRFVCPLVKS